MLFMRGRCLRGFHQLIYQSNGIHSSNILRSFSTSQNVIAAAAGSVDKSIIHPLGNEKFTKYITEIRDEYSRIENQYTDIDQQTAKRHQLLKQILDICDERKSIVDAFLALNEELANEKDKEMLALGEEEKSDYKENLAEHDEELKNTIISLNEDDDYSTVHLEVTAGVGGAEAQLFALEIFDMYTNYAEYKGWTVEVVQENRSDAVGEQRKMRHAKALITGPGTFRMLKVEAGVHRVQRVPATESYGRVHTSTATVAIIPQPDDFKLILHPKDLRIDTMRSSGPGGQNVNKLESAVRVVHLPSGIAVECQESRSQIKNKEIAMQKLHVKLSQIELEKQMATKNSMRKSQVSGSDRNLKIRTYNFRDDRITDHRIEKGSIFNIEEFFQGTEYLDTFIGRVKGYNEMRRLSEILDEIK